MRSRFLLVFVAAALLLVPPAHASDDGSDTFDGALTHFSGFWDFIYEVVEVMVPPAESKPEGLDDEIQVIWEEMGPTIVPTGQPATAPAPPSSDELAEELPLPAS